MKGCLSNENCYGKNPEIQRKHIKLHACRSRVTAVKNSNAMSELLLIYMIASFKLQLAIA